jgi:hypothetical protein
MLGSARYRAVFVGKQMRRANAEVACADLGKFLIAIDDVVNNRPVGKLQEKV